MASVMGTPAFIFHLSNPVLVGFVRVVFWLWENFKGVIQQLV